MATATVYVGSAWYSMTHNTGATAYEGTVSIATETGYFTNGTCNTISNYTTSSGANYATTYGTDPYGNANWKSCTTGVSNTPYSYSQGATALLSRNILEVEKIETK